MASLASLLMKVNTLFTHGKTKSARHRSWFLTFFAWLDSLYGSFMSALFSIMAADDRALRNKYKWGFLSKLHNKIKEGDILSIVKDYLIEQTKIENAQVNLKLVTTPEGDSNLVGAVGKLDYDSIEQVDFQEIGKQINYNGPISSLDDSFLVNPSSSETKGFMQKLLKKLQDE